MLTVVRTLFHKLLCYQIIDTLHLAFRKVLSYQSPTSLAVLQSHNKLIIHHESVLLSYSLDLVARVAQGQSTPQNLEGTLERLAGNDGSVLFFRAGKLAGRTLSKLP